MSALTENRETNRRDGKLLACPVAASTTIYKGGFVCNNTSGYAVAAAATLGFKLLGVSYEKINNASGSNGDKDIRVHRDGIFEFNCLETVAVTDIKKPVWISDDNTVTKVPGKVFAGVIVERVSSTKCFVDISPALRENGTYEVILTGDLTAATTTDGGAVLNLANPFGERVIASELILDVTTEADGAATVDAGIAATNTSNDSLIDGANVGAAPIVASNVDNPGTNGGKAAWPSASYLTITASATLAGLVGTYIVKVLLPTPTAD